MFDQAHNPKDYRVITPEGKTAGLVMVGKDENLRPARLTWNTFPNITNAVSVLRDHSLENISRSMGDAHKVRNFYNNIISPNALEGHVTVDTHAINGGLLRPLGSSDRQVAEGLGSAGPGDSRTGNRGLYALYSDAFRQAAEARGILPRQMQSITWEGQRNLWTPQQKNSKTFRESIDQIWNDYKTGALDGDEARAKILATSRRSGPP